MNLPSTGNLRIAILGDGLEAWMSAAYLARKARNVSAPIVISVPSEVETQSPAALSTTPSLRRFHVALGIDERDLVRYCRATFRLGTRFLNWTGAGSDFATPFAAAGAAVDGVAFHHYWLRSGQAASYEAYALGAAAARTHKFAHPSNDEAALQSSYDYGFHLDAGLYADYMRKCALHYGAQIRAAGFRRLMLDGETGKVVQIALDDGASVEADLVLDCTGGNPAGPAAQQGAPWRRIPAASKIDRIARLAVSSSESPSLTRMEATASGWMSDTPLQDTTCRTIAFSEGAPPTDAVETIAVENGRRAPWTGGVVAIGQSAASLDPVVDLRLDLVAAGLEHLAALLPAGGPASEATEYNRIMENVFDRAHDFQAFQYWLAEAPGGWAWAQGAGAAASQELQRKRSQFESRGRLVQYDEEIFDEDVWIASFLGGGVKPRRYDPLADNMPEDKARAMLESLRKAVAASAAAMPEQMNYLRRANALAPSGRKS
jgi:tryptophan 7-halogenase